MAEMTYLEAINLGISEEMARDEKVVILEKMSAATKAACSV